MNNEMTPMELFDMIKAYHTYDEESIIGCTVELLNAIRNDPDKFTLTLDEIIEDYAKEDGRCSCCGSRLCIDEDFIYCPSCSYINNK